MEASSKGTGDFTLGSLTPDASMQRTLFVGSLAAAVDTDILQAAFIPFGPVRNVELPIDRLKGVHKGFGFVEFEEEVDAEHALDNMHNSELYGRVIRVNFAKSIGRTTSSNKPIWADDFFYRQQLLSQGMQVDEDLLNSEVTEIT